MFMEDSKIRIVLPPFDVSKEEQNAYLLKHTAMIKRTSNILDSILNKPSTFGQKSYAILSRSGDFDDNTIGTRKNDMVYEVASLCADKNVTDNDIKNELDKFFNSV